MKNKPDKHYFDKLYRKSNYKFSFQYNEKILEDIISNKKTGTVLDFGCGEGGLSLALAKLGFKVTCVDMSMKAIDEIKNKAINENLEINAVCFDLEKYKIKENYDIIILCGILHFFGKDYSRMKIHKKTHLYTFWYLPT